MGGGTELIFVEGGSSDGTWELARELASGTEGVRALHLPAKGRGRALRAVWSESDAEVLAYTDVDLSTDLKALLPLVAAIVSGHSDIGIGSRLPSTRRFGRSCPRSIAHWASGW